MEVNLDDQRKPWLKIKLVLLVLWALFLVLTVNDKTDTYQNPLPLPDTSRVSWGYNFQTGQYRYESEYQGEIKEVKPSESNTELDITDEDVYDLKDYMMD